MDATVRVSDIGPGRSFCISIIGLDQIPWDDKIQRTFVRGILQNAFWRIFKTESNIEVLFGDECPACKEEIKEGSCSDTGCQYNYKG